MMDRIWVTRDGRQLLPSQMSDEHLAFAIAKIRRDGWRLAFLDRLELEQTIRALKRSGRTA